MKRTSSIFPSFYSIPKKVKGFNTETKSITCIENMPNEIFYEIFDYLNTFDFYETFFNLNKRFQNLLSPPEFLLKINLLNGSHNLLENRCNRTILPNNNQIISFHLNSATLIESFFSKYLIDSSFNSLQSIVLDEISEKRLLKCLFYFNSLPNLSSLTIYLNEKSAEWKTLYHMIFHLRSLKYLKMRSKYNPKADFIVPTTLNEPFSKLKYLIIHHSCTVNTLISMLNHTPQLSHLTCQQLNASKNEIANEISIRHLDLRFVFIRRCEVKFDDFETFITMFGTNLETLYINADVNQAYLDANRWQRLITNSMPRLSRFHLKYFGTRKNNSKNNQLDMKINQFISTFWFEEGCYLKIKIDSLFIQCSILPARKTWFSFQDNLQTDQNMATTEQENNDPSRIFSSHIQLFIPFKNDINLSEVLQMQMKSIFSTSLFLNLHVDCMNISSDVLMGILCLSPYFNSLKISSFDSIKLQHLSSENVEKGLRHLTSDSNKITKIYLEQLDSFANIDYLSTFCPHIQHLEVDCINDNHLLPTIQLILEKLTKNNLGIKYLCLHIPGINKKMTHPVQAMIEYKNLLINYTIEYKPNKIILQWK